MQYRLQAEEGLRNLCQAKLRSFLALLGILVGTASVVAMVLGGELATNAALKEFKTLGTDLLAATINNDEEMHSVSLNLKQAFELRESDKEIMMVAPYTQSFIPIFYQGNTINGTILGVTDHFADIMQIKLKAGRFISLLDDYAYYCVIGNRIYDAIKQFSFKEPIGQKLQIGKNIFVIVGIAQPWPENSFIYTNIDDAVLIPIKSTALVDHYSTINNFVMRLKPSADIERIQMKTSKRINTILGNRQITFRSAKELIHKMQKQSQILTIFLGLIGSISLLVGGIGVMNIMLVSVIERRREIGIRLALGASQKDISQLFLIEAIMLAMLGGIGGVTVGILIAYAIALLSHWEFTLFLWPPIAGFSVSVAVGVFSGFYPAYTASKLNPVEALRMD